MSQIFSLNTDKVIKSIKLCKCIQNQHKKAVLSILKLSDIRYRITMGCEDGAISLNQLNYDTREWKILALKNKSHDSKVHSFCELSNKRLVSSAADKLIKVWNVS